MKPETAGNTPELFRSKSVEKLAMRWTGNNAAQMWEFCEKVTFEWIPEQGERQAQHHFCIATLEGIMRGSVGDWLIRGLSGEFYPCKPDIFANSYERVAAPSQEAAPAPVQGSWPLGVHRAFVAGADWWQWHANKATMFASERDEAEAEAVRKFGPVGAEPSASQEAAPSIAAFDIKCQVCGFRALACGHNVIWDKVAEPVPSPATTNEWICEDELPKGYPYHEMFPHSKLGQDGRGGVRIFPKVAPSPATKETRSAWTKLPNEQAWYWWWNGEDYDVPYICSVLISKTGDDRYFVADGKNAPWCDEMGGWWLKIARPNVPSREWQKSISQGPAREETIAQLEMTLWHWAHSDVPLSLTEANRMCTLIFDAGAQSRTPTNLESRTVAQHTICAICTLDKATPLRIDWLGGYVCLRCVEEWMNSQYEKEQARTVAPQPDKEK